MDLRIERRAEIALRSLPKIEQKYIDRALADLLTLDRTALRHNHKIQALMTDRKLFVYRGSPKLRLVVSFEGETCVLEDIVDHDRLGRLVKREGQE